MFCGEIGGAGTQEAKKDQEIGDTNVLEQDWEGKSIQE